MVTPVDQAALYPLAADPGRGGNGAKPLTPGAEPNDGFELFGKDGFTFADLIDIVNPLQHIPILSSLYRSITGDNLDPGARIIGGTLFGGPIGAGAAIVNTVVDANTGKDIGDHVFAFFSNKNDGTGDAPPTRTAALPPQPAEAEARRLNAFATAAGGGQRPRHAPEDEIVRPAPDLGLLGSPPGNPQLAANTLAGLRHPAFPPQSASREAFDNQPAGASREVFNIQPAGARAPAADVDARRSGPKDGDSGAGPGAAPASPAFVANTLGELRHRSFETAALEARALPPVQADGRAGASRAAASGAAAGGVETLDGLRHPASQIALAEIAAAPPAPGTTGAEPAAPARSGEARGDGWIIDAISRGLEKYQAGAKVRHAPPTDPVSTVR